jgi:hypothetical protein
VLLEGISKPSQYNDETGKFNKSVKEISMVLVASDQPSKVLKPTDRSLDFPATTVSAERAPILCGGLRAVLSVRANQFDTATRQPFAQRIAIGGQVVDQSSRFSWQNASFEQRLNKSHFVWARTRRVDGERKTMAIGEDHDLGALAAFGLADLFTPFFAD